MPEAVHLVDAVNCQCSNTHKLFKTVGMDLGLFLVLVTIVPRLRAINCLFCLSEGEGCAVAGGCLVAECLRCL